MPVKFQAKIENHKTPTRHGEVRCKGSSKDMPKYDRPIELITDTTIICLVCEKEVKLVPGISLS